MAGAADITRVSMASRAAARSGAAESRTIARPSTSPAHAPIDCRIRATTRVQAFGATLVAIPASVNSASPASSTGRRPNWSDIGPYSNWPIARPIRYSVMVSWIVPGETPSARAVSGSAGMIRCMPSVPQAVIATISTKGARSRLP